MFFLLRIASWLLGCLDWLYIRFSKLGKRAFFKDAYGDVSESLLYLQHYNDVVLPEMLGSDAAIPNLAASVIEQLNAQVDLTTPSSSHSIQSVQGSFHSPMADWLPTESKECAFMVLKPPQGVAIRAVCVMLPATADQGFSLRRKQYADALAKKGVLGILVVAPYYGRRRPAGQSSWFLPRLHDSFVQAGAITLEAACLLHWARYVWRLPLAVTGASFGGAMAAATAQLFSGPLAVVPYMAPTGPGEPFSEGALQHSVCWDGLRHFPQHPNLPIAVPPSTSMHDVKTFFQQYCSFFTSTAEWRYRYPCLARGKQAVVSLHGRDDRFVLYREGWRMYGVLQYLTAPHNTDAGVHVNGQAGHAHEPLLPNSTATGAKARFITFAGGHTWGFMRCQRLLPPAVLSALEMLQAQV